MSPTKKRRKTTHGVKRNDASKSHTKATTTALVNHFFQSLFPDHMIKNSSEPSYDSYSSVDDEEFTPCVVLVKKLEDELDIKTSEEKENLNSESSKVDKKMERKTPSSLKFGTALKEYVIVNTPESDLSNKRGKPGAKSKRRSEHLRGEIISSGGNSNVSDIISSPPQNGCEVTKPKSKSSRKSDNDLTILEDDLKMEATLNKNSKSKANLRRSSRTDIQESQNEDYNGNSTLDEKSDNDLTVVENDLKMEGQLNTSILNKNSKSKPNLRRSLRTHIKKSQNENYNGNSNLDEICFKETVTSLETKIPKKIKTSAKKSIGKTVAQKEELSSQDDSSFPVMIMSPVLKKGKTSARKSSMKQTMTRGRELSDADASFSEKAELLKSVPLSSIKNKSKGPKLRQESVGNVSFEIEASPKENNINNIDLDSTFESKSDDENVFSLETKPKRNPKRQSLNRCKEDSNAKKTKNKRKFSADNNEDVEPSLPLKKRKFNDVEPCSFRLMGSESYQVGNFVSVRHKREIGLIKKIWRADDGQIMCHVQWFIRSADTILGEEGNPREIFLTESCEDLNLNEANEILDVSRLLLSNWDQIGPLVLKGWSNGMSKENPKALFYQKRYEPKVGHFTTIPEKDEKTDKCSSCEKEEELKNREIPVPVDELKVNEKTRQCAINAVRWRGQIFSVKTSIFLKPGSLQLPEPKPVNETSIHVEYDEDKYPERYRKSDTIEDDTIMEEPFDIGYICGMFSEKTAIGERGDVYVHVKKFYRPHNTHLLRHEANGKDLNLLYWSDEECVVTFERVEGKCFVTYEQNLDFSVEEWTSKGPHRFYFVDAFDRKTLSFIQPPAQARILGDMEHERKFENVPFEWPKIPRPLYMMDVFAGCGGLSEGLQQSGVAECRWAIDNADKPAAAFQLNNERAIVYVDDCTEFLEKVKKCKNGKLPKKGDVELLVGGPPCTGLSKMGQPNSGDCMLFEGSLIGAYLSYCEYFCPRFVILENVRDFLSAAKSVIFKKSLSRLIELGYQVSFAVLQCGKYGIPQSRRRAVIFAAGPGEVLPAFPEPTHAFPLKQNVDINVGGKKFTINFQWTTGPYRAITVADALSDLPVIYNDEGHEEMLYSSEPKTHFQAMVRGIYIQSDDVLRDHICKRLTDLNWVRASYIPHKPIGDWRDLPNVEVQLPDGTYTEKLEYTHRDCRNGEAKNGDFRGVCPCVSKKKGGKCNKAFRQTNTLIPWCLVHTANRHNNWNGLFGRVGWNGYFRTVVAHPEPMGKQGRVLHPSQHRVFSIRECARSQGFPDTFRFYGNILDKYHQVGNAVTPPLAKALGYEIRKCVAERT